jgi:hypothetical protein
MTAVIATPNRLRRNVLALCLALPLGATVFAAPAGAAPAIHGSGPHIHTNVEAIHGSGPYIHGSGPTVVAGQM